MIPCLEQGCTYHVYFDWSAPPMPAFITLDVLYNEGSNQRMPYLTCDNPVTPHTYKYIINKPE